MSTTSDTNIFHDFAYEPRPLRLFAFGFKAASVLPCDHSTI